MNIELSKKLFILEIKEQKKYWTLKAQVLYKLKNKRK
jgi:hypothetical protein